MALGFYDKIPIYSIFYLLKGDYRVGGRDKRLAAGPDGPTRPCG